MFGVTSLGILMVGWWHRTWHSTTRWCGNFIAWISFWVLWIWWLFDDIWILVRSFPTCSKHQSGNYINVLKLLKFSILGAKNTHKKSQKHQRTRPNPAYYLLYAKTQMAILYAIVLGESPRVPLARGIYKRKRHKAQSGRHSLQTSKTFLKDLFFLFITHGQKKHLSRLFINPYHLILIGFYLSPLVWPLGSPGDRSTPSQPRAALELLPALAVEEEARLWRISGYRMI